MFIGVRRTVCGQHHLLSWAWTVWKWGKQSSSWTCPHSFLSALTVHVRVPCSKNLLTWCPHMADCNLELGAKMNRFLPVGLCQLWWNQDIFLMPHLLFVTVLLSLGRVQNHISSVGLLISVMVCLCMVLFYFMKLCTFKLGLKVRYWNRDLARHRLVSSSSG